jgi:curved DNA-binding protein CbpA
VDRRAESERADRDDRFRKALGVIRRAYKGETPETVYRDATGCFDSLIEISHGGNEVRDFALRNEVDFKYLMDGANFVISMMHFNPENNYYVTLGISGIASQEEIRERWKKLMLLYHPDRQGEDKEWFSERAKKVNEAYSGLKDLQKRAAFDKKLSDDYLRRQSSRLHAAASASTGGQRAIQHPVRRGGGGGKRPAFLRYLPALLVVCYIAAAAVFIVSINLQNKSASLERELQPAGKADGSQASEEREKLSAAAGKRAGDLRKGTAGKGADVGLDKREAILRQDTHTHGDAKVGAPEKGAAPKTSAAPLTAAGLKEKTDVMQTHREKGPSPAGTPPRGKIEEERLRQEPAAVVTRGEVEDFVKRYAESYRHGRLDEFLGLFSKRAVENGTLDYRMIRDSYRKTFSSGIALYRLNNIQIRIYGTTVRVSGVYTVARYGPSGRPARNYSGRITWTLEKEDNTLKIVEADYGD